MRTGSGIKGGGSRIHAQSTVPASAFLRLVLECFLKCLPHHHHDRVSQHGGGEAMTLKNSGSAYQHMKKQVIRRSFKNSKEQQRECEKRLINSKPEFMAVKNLYFRETVCSGWKAELGFERSRFWFPLSHELYCPYIVGIKWG